MKIKETISTFLMNKQEGIYYESSRVTYRRKLDVFFEFLVTKCSLSDDNFEDILRGMDEKRFVESAAYYIEQYNVQFISTIDNYLSVIISYFRFVRDSLKITNSIIDSEVKQNNLKEAIHLMAKKYSLIPREQKSPITEKVFNKLLDYCDECIENPKSELIKTTGYNKAFTNWVSAIATKLVMLTGLKNKCVKSLIRDDFNDELNIIRINKLWIHLPNRYLLQFREYIRIRDSIVGINPNDALFITNKGRPLTNYASMFEVLYPILGCKEVESVAKFVIIQQIKAGFPLQIIKKLTGFSIESCLHCLESLEEENEDINMRSINREVDSKLRGLEIFDRL